MDTADHIDDILSIGVERAYDIRGIVEGQTTVQELRTLLQSIPGAAKVADMYSLAEVGKGVKKFTMYFKEKT